MEMRTVQVNRNGLWQSINFRDLNEGDNFRLYEPNGDAVVDTKGNEVFYSTSEPYKNEEGIWTIDVLN
jgi:hypothetical protein